MYGGCALARQGGMHAPWMRRKPLRTVDLGVAAHCSGAQTLAGSSQEFAAGAAASRERSFSPGAPVSRSGHVLSLARVHGGRPRQPRNCSHVS